jgi:hypothetical protein
MVDHMDAQFRLGPDLPARNYCLSVLSVPAWKKDEMLLSSSRYFHRTF